MFNDSFYGKVLLYKIQRGVPNYEQETICEFANSRRDAKQRLWNAMKDFKVIEADYYIVVDGISERHYSIYIPKEG